MDDCADFARHKKCETYIKSGLILAPIPDRRYHAARMILGLGDIYMQNIEGSRNKGGCMEDRWTGFCPLRSAISSRLTPPCSEPQVPRALFSKAQRGISHFGMDSGSGPDQELSEHEILRDIHKIASNCEDVLYLDAWWYGLVDKYMLEPVWWNWTSSI
jgi:hypothetical protein